MILTVKEKQDILECAGFQFKTFSDHFTCSVGPNGLKRDILNEDNNSMTENPILIEEDFYADDTDKDRLIKDCFAYICGADGSEEEVKKTTPTKKKKKNG